MEIESPLEKAFRLSGRQKQALKKLGLLCVRDLLFHFPRAYGDALEAKYVCAASAGENVLLCGRLSNVEKARAFRKKTPMAKAVLEDETGKIKVVWFHQPYLAEKFGDGAVVCLRGKIAKNKQGLYLANPDVGRYEGGHAGGGLLSTAASEGRSGAPLIPVYSESRGVTSRWIYYAVKKILAANVHKKIEDPLSRSILVKYHLPSLSSALVWIHEPKKKDHALAARKRFAFEEVFFIQLSRQKSRFSYASRPSFPVGPSEAPLGEFVKRFPFKLTGAQKRAIGAIIRDFKKGTPMSRLLEGDVGSGKTVVAAATAYAVVASRPLDPETGKRQSFGSLQAAYMAPTEILAKQHFESFVELFKDTPIQIGLITGSGCKKFPSKVDQSGATGISRGQLLRWVAGGEVPLLVGTHALIQKTVAFKHLAYVIIDEQHRFGTMQRYALARKETRAPHLLSMTATPIPRTLALTIYGDLDLTLLDEMPPGRKHVATKIVPGGERRAMYEHVRAELAAGRQAYVICPKIEFGDGKLEVRNVKDEAERLKKEEFPEARIEILHSKVKTGEKEETMKKFLAREIDILVSTSVVEVGVNVPNTTVIIIEGAERFGLAQLHQLRGRVLRSTHQAYCYLLSERGGIARNKRVLALQEAKTGFELAELDLRIRGPGELAGRQQWGISDIGMEALKNLKMVEAARTEASALLKDDPELKKHPLIKKRLAYGAQNIHFE